MNNMPLAHEYKTGTGSDRISAFQANFAEKIKTHFIFNNIFSPKIVNFMR
jgi:hypothetical protein